MKTYPSILYPGEKSYGKYGYFFRKEDGSNLRFEYSQKRGWWKFGTRTRLFDASDADFGSAIALFLDKYGDELPKAIHCSNMIAYCEFFGYNSFAGQHIRNEPKEIVLFDVNIHKKGFLGPKEFIDTCGHLKTADLLYQGEFTQELENEIYDGKFPVNEGVVIKGGSGHHLWMLKVKTKAYKEKLREFFKSDWEKYW